MVPVMETVKPLSTDQKFTLINLLIPVPDWHAAILEERERTLANGSARLLDWEDVKADLQAAPAAAR